MRRYPLNGYRLLAWEDEKVLEMDDVSSCKIMRIYSMPLNCASKNDKMVQFMLCIFTTIKKEVQSP